MAGRKTHMMRSRRSTRSYKPTDKVRSNYRRKLILQLNRKHPEIRRVMRYD